MSRSLALGHSAGRAQRSDASTANGTDVSLRTMGDRTGRWLQLLLWWCMRDLREAARALADCGIEPELQAELSGKADELLSISERIARA